MNLSTKGNSFEMQVDIIIRVTIITKTKKIRSPEKNVNFTITKISRFVSEIIDVILEFF